MIEYLRGRFEGDVHEGALRIMSSVLEDFPLGSPERPAAASSGRFENTLVRAVNLEPDKAHDLKYLVSTIYAAAGRERNPIVRDELKGLALTLGILTGKHQNRLQSTKDVHVETLFTAIPKNGTTVEDAVYDLSGGYGSSSMMHKG